MSKKKYSIGPPLPSDDNPFYKNFNPYNPYLPDLPSTKNNSFYENFNPKKPYDPFNELTNKELQELNKILLLNISTPENLDKLYDSTKSSLRKRSKIPSFSNNSTSTTFTASTTSTASTSASSSNSTKTKKTPKTLKTPKTTKTPKTLKTKKK